MLPPETLLLVDRVQNTIALGEGQFREFKSALQGTPGNKKPRSVGSICGDIAEALVAFANADGGDLLVGVEDNREITGLQHSSDEIALLLKAPISHVHPKTLLPVLAATELELNRKRILFFSVAKGTTGIFQLTDGRCMRRVENASIPEHADQLLFDRQETRSREFDRNFTDGAKVTDLDLDLITSIADSYLRGLSAERYLQQLGLAEYAPGGLRLRMAALLLFAKNVSLWHPRSQVRILKVAGTELKAGEQYNVQSDEVVSGNIYHLLVKAWEVMRPFLAYRTEFGASGTFEQKYIYPELACREALVNAIAHRDYSVQNGVDVFVFDDRMEFRNPGALLSTLKMQDLQNLQGAHESRNSLVAKVLRESKFMRELGEGMKRIFELMTQNELQKPLLESDSSSFSITLQHRSVFSAQQEQWLLMFQQFELTPLQKKIMVLGMNDRDVSQADIVKAINTTDRNVYDSEITDLRKAKLLLEVRSNSESSRYARTRRIKKSEVPRFKVQIPTLPNASSTDVEQSTVAAKIASNNVGFNRRHKLRFDPEDSIYVSNLPYEMTEDSLLKIFQHIGAVKKIYLPHYHAGGSHKGFCFVRFQDKLNAKKAIAVLNGREFSGRMLTVREFQEKDTRPAKPTASLV